MLTSPFRGSRAIAEGLVTAKQLRGPRYARLFPDVCADAALETTFALRSRAAYLLVQGRGVLCGYSAAELLRAGCGPPDAAAEVRSPGGGGRRHAGLRVHRGRLFADEACEVDGVALTTRLANPLSGSPMETRIRLSIVLAGLPPPVLQHPVGPYFLDMAYPELTLGIEYDGREYLSPDRALRDLAREGYLGRRGWDVLRFPARAV